MLALQQIVVNAQPLLELKSVEPLGNEVNSSAEEGYPLYAPDGKLYFVRSLFEGNVGGRFAGQDIWFIERTATGWSAPSNDVGKLNNRFNNGVVGIADSGRVLYLNSTYSNKPDYQIGLSKTEWNNGQWSSPQRVSMRGFDPKSSYFTFYVDEKNEVMLLSFSKDGTANEDIFISIKRGSGWGVPIRLGNICSDGAEFAPFLSEDGRVLYFSSNGFAGKGDVDIFMSRRIDNSWTNWSQPVSLPEPINSEKFDAYFTIKGLDAFFSSNRNSEFADLFHAKYEKRVPTKEEEEEMKQEELFAQGMRLDGFVVLSESGVLRELEVLDADGNVVQTLQADETGRFELSELDNYAKYYIDLKGKDLDDADVFIVNRRGDRVYLNKELVSGKFPFETLDKDIQAVLIAEVKDESAFQGTGFELDAKNKVEGIGVTLMNAEGKLVEETKIDDKGKFEFKKLQTGEYYTLSTTEEFEDPILYLRQGGKVIPMSTALLKGMLFKKIQDGSIILYQDELLAQSDAAKFKFDYESLNIAGTEVFLYNENGDLLQSAIINEKGLFAFSRLDAESKYKIGLSEEIDPSLGRLTGFNESGDSVALATQLLMGEFFKGNPAWAVLLNADQEGFRFDYDNLPPAGTVVYLTDEDDNVIDSALVDADGNFAFARLRPDMAYKIKLANADDMSMGLNRFFVIDAEGEKIGFNEDGSSTKNLVGQELAAQTEKFTFAEESLPPEGSVVYLTDENDNIIDSAVVDENGEFRFMRLKPDGNYKIKLAATDDMSMGLSRFFVIDAEGEKIGFNEQGVTEREVAGKALAESTERFQFDYNNLPAAGTVVYLTDENNNIIDSATVDANGGLRYKRLDDKDTYKLKLAKTEDVSEGLSGFALIDAEGDLITFNENGTSNTSLVGKEAAKQTEAFQFSEESRPEEGSVVYLTDENDNIIDSAVVDENGEFRFARLTPFGAYKIKLQDAQDQSKGLSSFFIYDATGTKIELDETGTTTQRIIGKEEAKVVRFYAFDYGQLPPDGTVIYITDGNDKIVDSVIVKNGAFRYKKLSTEAGFGLQMRYPDGSMFFGDSFRLLIGEKEDEQKPLLLSNTLNTKDYFDQLTEAELEERFDQFEFDGEPPLVGTKIYIFSDAGLIQDSAIIYSKGRFNVSKLKNQEEYIIKVGDADYDVRKSELYALIKNERRKLSRLDQAFSYRPITVADEEDTKFNFDKFIIEVQEPIAQGTEVYLYENDAQRYVDTAAVAEDGSFQFKQLDREKQYSLKFDDQFDVASAKVYSVTDEGQKVIEQNETGFNVDPVKLLKPQQETITLVLGTIEDDRDIQLDQKETKPFPLTPPVNEKQEPIHVEKNVVNETVFEPAAVKTTPTVNQVKTAVATLDDSDWRSMMGKGDIYETPKGYNLHFGFNEFLLNPNQIEYLKKVVIPILRANPDLTLTVEGHTDNIGSEEVNHRMAVLRASNVLYHLEMNGVEDTRLRILSKGESQPIAPNDIPEGRAINRRVEIIKNK